MKLIIQLLPTGSQASPARLAFLPALKLAYDPYICMAGKTNVHYKKNRAGVVFSHVWLYILFQKFVNGALPQ